MCKNHPFVQLHSHSSFSLLDGVADYKKTIARAIKFNHKAIAISDHGNPAGLFDFNKECKKQGIKPILGLEFYINNDLTSRFPNKNRQIDERDYHQSVYIKNKAGYLNFNYLTYVSNTDGFYYKPRIDFKLLFKHSEGLMITSSCMASKIGNYVRNENYREAEEAFNEYVYAFGEDFYGEIQFNEVEGQKQINDFIIHQCKKHNVKVIIGGDCHYLDPEDNLLQDAVIKSKRDAGEVDWVISARKLYFHDTTDYFDFNKELGWNYNEDFIIQCFQNSVEFADKVNFDFETGKYHLPKIDTGDLSSKDFLEKVTWEGLIANIETIRKYFPEKYSNEDIDKLEKQIQYELGVINDMGLNDYLLIVYDIIKFEKEQGLYVGVGRGSAAGAATCWALNICAIDPIEHGLKFERFINPNRRVMADIDWDSEANGRGIILEYLITKYGRESVVNVPTFGTYKVKSALQAMSRGLRKETGNDTVLMRKICKLELIADDKKKWKDGELMSYFREIRNKTIDQEIVDWIEDNQDTITYSQKLLGQITTIGTHAGGIVITPKPIYNYIPVTRSSTNLVAAFKEADGSSKDLSELGILKLDALGVTALDILKECVNRIKIDTGEDLSERINHLDLKDKELIEYFSKGNNFGIFQMDRSKMLTSQFENDNGKVDCFEDIVAINAMNRPGPLDKFLKKYGKWKGIDNGNIKLSPEELEKENLERYPFPFMEKVLSETHGAMLYQEQLMNIFCEITGLTFGDADSFRRAVGWAPEHPKYSTVKKYFDAVENSMEEKGYSKKDSDFLLSYLKDFEGYSFCKCLSDNTFVDTKTRGKINILNVEIGEEILGYDSLGNKYNKIKSIINNGINEVYEITTESGKKIECTMNHKIMSQHGMKTLEYILEKEIEVLINV